MRKYLAVIVILVLGVLYASVFTVQQTERGIVLRFG